MLEYELICCAYLWSTKVWDEELASLVKEIAKCCQDLQKHCKNRRQM